MPDYFEFEVELTGVKPRIWRRFLVPKAATFLDLHQAIQDACGWLDYHLFSFYAKRPYEESIAGIPDDSGMSEFPITDASQKKLSSYFSTGKGKKKSCGYQYDFGDDWLHKVTLKGVVKLKEKLPRVLLAGKRAFPPEDCGSISGYEHCVEVATGSVEIDPADPYVEEEIESRREWLGDWHPEKFDLEAVKEKFDKGRGAPGGFGPEPGEDDLVPSEVDMLQGTLESSPEEYLKAGIVAAVGARGRTEPWTSLIGCQEPLGKKGCKGLYEVWIQEVPPTVGWRCPKCKASGTINELLGGTIGLPDFRIRRSDEELARVTMPLEEYEALTACDDLMDDAKSIVVGAGYENGKAVIEFDGDEIDILHLAVSTEASHARGKRQKLLGKLAERIELAEPT